MSPLPAISPATNVPCPLVSVTSDAVRPRTRTGAAPGAPKVPPVVKPGCVLSMPESTTATSTLEPLNPSQLPARFVVSVVTPVLTRLKSLAWTREWNASTICTPGNAASAVQFCGGATRTIGPNGDWSRARITPPSCSIRVIVRGAPSANRPRVNTAPSGSGRCSTAAPSSDD